MPNDLLVQKVSQEHSVSKRFESRRNKRLFPIRKLSDAVAGNSQRALLRIAQMINSDTFGLAIADLPPPPLGYDPNTWQSGIWDNGVRVGFWSRHYDKTKTLLKSRPQI